MLFFVKWLRTRNIATSLFLIGLSSITMLLGIKAFSGTAHALTTTLGWSPSTSTGVAGYKVYYGTSSGNYTQSVDAGAQTSAGISGLQLGQQYYFAVKSYDAQGNQSAFSKELVYTMNDLAVIPYSQLTIASVDSQELVAENGAATNAIDGNPSTIWHTQYDPTSTPYPHQIVIKLNGWYQVNGFRYLPRQDGGINGTVANYSFYVSTDGVNWGTPVASGTFAKDTTLKQVLFTGKEGYYVKLVGLSEVNGNPWMSAAEISVLGTPNSAIPLPSSQLSVVSADSEELVGEYAPAEYAIDGKTTTFWHTQWYNVNPAPGYPHQIIVALGGSYNVTGFRYLPRQDGGINGTVANYNFYVSTDGINWGQPVVSGTFAKDTTQKEVLFSGKTGSYIKFQGLSEVNGNPWMSAAEIGVLSH